MTAEQKVKKIFPDAFAVRAINGETSIIYSNPHSPDRPRFRLSEMRSDVRRAWAEAARVAIKMKKEGKL